jgi:hypothetical protein
MKIRVISTLVSLVVSFLAVNMALGEITANEILRRADEARGNLAGVKWELRILSLENKRQQKRSIVVKAKGYDSLAVLTSPPRVKGQKLLMVDHNMWFAKPGVRKPVPISPRQKLTGGASNGDIAATNYANDYESTGLGDDIIGGESCYVFDLKAINKKATYDHIKYWISKQRLVGVKAEFFSVSGKMFKWARFEYENRVAIRNEPHVFVSKIVITDALISKNVTTLEIIDPVLEEIPDSVFNLIFLMRR